MPQERVLFHMPLHLAQEVRMPRHVELSADYPQVIVTEGNLQDTLAASDACISISSSVVIKVMLNRKPAILFGRSDLHNCATTIRTLEDFAALGIKPTC